MKLAKPASNSRTRGFRAVPKASDNRKLLAVCWLIGCTCFAVSGCQRRAYTDLYTESMAGEIRELEDRIYEYDAAYQGIESELAVLQSENARLHQQLAASQSGALGSSSAGKGLFKNRSGTSNPSGSSESFNLRESYPVESEPSFQVVPKPDPVPNIVPAVPSKSSGESKTPSVDKLPTPAETKPTKPSPRSDKKETEPPAVELGTPSNALPPNLLNPSNIPSPPSGLLNPNNATPPTNPIKPSDALPAAPALPSTPGGTNDVLPAPLNFSAPPTTSNPTRMSNDRSVQTASSIVPVDAKSDSLRPSESSASIAVQALPEAIDDEAIKAGRIELPSSLRSNQTQNSRAESSPTTTQDNKVVEIAFHPTLCRGQYLGSNDKGDGLHLVLQPRNASGEALDTPAALTVVVLDPNRPEEQSKLGRWTFTQEEVDAQLEPIGVGRGFHIALPWQEAKPSSDVVQVYIRYEMNDGRRLVNERRLQIHVPSVGSASWTPRVAK
jgi:hypothetical protein